MVLFPLLVQKLGYTLFVHQSTVPPGMELVFLFEVFVLEDQFWDVLNLEPLGELVASMTGHIDQVELELVGVVDGHVEESLVLHREGVFSMNHEVDGREA